MEAPVLSLKEVLPAPVEAIRSCCLMGAWEESCWVTCETRAMADFTVREDIVWMRGLCSRWVKSNGRAHQGLGSTMMSAVALGNDGASTRCRSGVVS